MAGGFLDVAGRRIYCRYEGAESGRRPVFLLHGLGASSYSWRHILPLLGREYTVYAPDLPGFGRSDAPENFPFSPEGLSAFLQALMDRLKIPRADLIGNSMGGVVALHAALHSPERVGKLVLLGTPTYPHNTPKIIWNLRRPFLGLLMERLLGRWTVRLCARSAFYDASLITRELLDEYSLALKRPGGRRAVAEFIRNAVPPDAQQLIERFSKLDRPVLVIWGTHDPVVDEASVERFVSEVPGARLVKLANCGHAPQEERPLAVADELLAFLRG